MNRSRTAWVCFTIAIALTVPAPDAIRPWIEEARNTGASLFARPLDAEALAAPRLDRILVEPAREDGVPVIWSSRRHDTLVIGAGWEQGLRTGQIVARGERFLGFVDRVESHVARVRMPGHRGTRFGVVITGPDGETLQRVLLEGDGAGHARPRSGRLIEASALGRDARRPGATGLLVGVVEIDDAGRPSVVVPRADAIGDHVTVLDPEDERPLPIQPAVLFEACPGPALAAGSSSPGRAGFLVPFGHRDGVRPGDLVSRSDRIVGVVERVGQSTARVTPGAWLTFLTRRDEEGRERLRGRVQAGSGPIPAGLQTGASLADETAEPDDPDFAVHVFRHRRDFLRLVRGLG